ncbi:MULTISPECIES: (d)CMP kinase [Atopobiaceae]|uniref:(d)CMP kinase n=1 Tax=Atopobiaceae TaxID=1643824 RepID=UPI000B368323|nr:MULTISPECIES: (d)CMP kinase [Atopobiaceae]MCR8908747.1 (d)CMP kinase [Thermophilibacter sp. ET337]OUO32652.1 cytidylate kinase [Olsenella sp. An293]
MIVAIDGPSGSGKSSVAREVARRCGLTYLDTGAMYRSVAHACLERGVDPADDAATAEVARGLAIEFLPDGEGQRVIAGGEDVTAQIRTPEVERAVSPVSANPAVREAMVAAQRRFGETGDVIAEGRDIGTVVFPAADVKVFLSASPEARARRRAVQRGGGDLARGVGADVDAKEERAVLEALVRRDAYDSSRAASPLRPAADAARIDSSELPFEEVVRAVIALSPELSARAERGQR